MIRKVRQEVKENDSSHTYIKEYYTVQSMKRNKKEVLSFLKEVVRNSSYLKEEDDRQMIGVHVYDASRMFWDLFKECDPRPVDKIIIDNLLRNNLVKDLDEWHASFDWYKERGITYKRGYLFHGMPGNGKSSLIMSIAKKYNRAIYYLNINALKSEGELLTALTRVRNRSILVFEDFDTVYIGRDAVNPDCKISFSTILNSLDGVLDKNDLLVFITTNNIGDLDPALIRPGRIDFNVEIKNPTIDLVDEYLSLFYKKDIKLKSYDHDFSMAKIQNLCIINRKSELEVINILERKTNE